MTDIPLERRLSVAPMMGYTDRHGRFFLRQFTRRTLLYSEMIATGQIIYGDAAKFLKFDPAEHPIALQLGGSDPEALAQCAEVGVAAGYDEVNLNAGCPSKRVNAGAFGACLMADPALVARSVRAMAQAVDKPITVKCRLGIDGQESYEGLRAFVEGVFDAGAASVTVHARVAVLGGLTPKENREIPPLQYDWVQRLKSDLGDAEIVLNGGVQSLDDVETHLNGLDGVMIGRAACANPMMLATADARIFGEPAAPVERERIANTMLSYIDSELASGTRLNAITRHMFGLFQGRPAARMWRRFLSENGAVPGAGREVVEKALEVMGDPSAALQKCPDISLAPAV